MRKPIQTNGSREAEQRSTLGQGMGAHEKCLEVDVTSTHLLKGCGLSSSLQPLTDSNQPLAFIDCLLNDFVDSCIISCHFNSFYFLFMAFHFMTVHCVHFMYISCSFHVHFMFISCSSHVHSCQFMSYFMPCHFIYCISCIPSFLHCFFHSSIHSSIHPSIRPSVHPSIHPSICSCVLFVCFI